LKIYRQLDILCEIVLEFDSPDGAAGWSTNWMDRQLDGKLSDERTTAKMSTQCRHEMCSSAYIIMHIEDTFILSFN